MPLPRLYCQWDYICFTEPREKSLMDCTIESPFKSINLLNILTHALDCIFCYKLQFDQQAARRLKRYLTLNLPIVPYLCFI